MTERLVFQKKISKILGGTTPPQPFGGSIPDLMIVASWR